MSHLAEITSFNYGKIPLIILYDLHSIHSWLSKFKFLYSFNYFMSIVLFHYQVIFLLFRIIQTETRYTVRILLLKLLGSFVGRQHSWYDNSLLKLKKPSLVYNTKLYVKVNFSSYYIKMLIFSLLNFSIEKYCTIWHVQKYCFNYFYF